MDLKLLSIAVERVFGFSLCLTKFKRLFGDAFRLFDAVVICLNLFVKFLIFLRGCIRVGGPSFYALHRQHVLLFWRWPLRIHVLDDFRATRLSTRPQLVLQLLGADDLGRR